MCISHFLFLINLKTGSGHTQLPPATIHRLIPYIPYADGNIEVQFPPAVTVKAVVNGQAFDEVLVAVGKPVGIGVEGARAVGYLLIHCTHPEAEVEAQVAVKHLVAPQQAEARIIPRHLKVIMQDDIGAGIVVIVGMRSGVAVVVGRAQPDELPVYSPPLNGSGIVPHNSAEAR